MTDVTKILSQIEQGDPSAAAELLPLVYDELRKLAARRMAKEAPGQTLQPTALVHEAYLRLVDGDTAQHWDSKGHFFAAAARAMRRILVERSRRQKAKKHGGDLRRVELCSAHALSERTPDEIVSLDDSLTRLAKDEPGAANVVDLHLFAGFSIEEAADLLGISRATAYRHWTYARAWLKRELSFGETENK